MNEDCDEREDPVDRMIRDCSPEKFVEWLVKHHDVRHKTMLQWCEPWPACGPEGNDLDAHIILRATIHDCINLQRRAAKAAGRPTMGDDGNHLLDFMAIHWARVVEANADLSDTRR